MNPEIKKLWVNALRSGKYRQGKNYLRVETKYCCLGVLCEIAVQQKIIPPAHDVDGMGVYTISPYMPPLKVVEWANLPVHGNPEIMVGGVFRTMSGHNDSGATFEQIADAIESQL